MNVERYKKDLSQLIEDGNLLFCAIQRESHREDFDRLYKKELGEKFDNFVKKIPRFSSEYQRWYSESLVLIRQLVSDRANDFVRLYEKPKTRKGTTHENYSIEDCLFGLSVTRGWEKEKVVGPEAAIPRFEQQLNILKSVEKRFESSLFDIRQLVRADVFDDELEVAEELLKKGFVRASGAVAGVVLEGHLQTVCENHQIKASKKNPGISDYNNLLRDGNVIDTPDWRRIQHLGDLRNTCDHKKKSDPKKEDIEELIKGTRKVTKTLF